MAQQADKRLKYVKKSSDKTLNYTLGVVYPVNKVDKQDDWADEETVRQAAWEYMKSLQSKSDVEKIALSIFESFTQVAKGEADEVIIDITNMDVELTKSLGDMHTVISDDLGVVVESFIAPADMTFEQNQVRKGDWLVGVVWSDKMFEKILNGERTGYSIGGKGVYAE